MCCLKIRISNPSGFAVVSQYFVFCPPTSVSRTSKIFYSNQYITSSEPSLIRSVLLRDINICAVCSVAKNIKSNLQITHNFEASDMFERICKAEWWHLKVFVDHNLKFTKVRVNWGRVYYTNEVSKRKLTFNRNILLKYS